MKFFKFTVMLLFVLSASACNETKNEKKFEKWEIKRGVNISHWLSQNGRKEASPERYDGISEKDFETIAAAGFDHIRLPIDERELWTEDGEKIEYTFDLMHKAVEWCEKYDMRILIDLHIIRSHHFNSEEINTLFTSEESQLRLLKMWKDLSDELKKYPNGFLAYELMNEPVAPEHDMWNKLVARMLEEIRRDEPERKIFVGSNRWQGLDFLRYLELPADDKNLVVSFHFYEPFLITHYHAGWIPDMMKVTCPINYPGRIISEEDENNLDPELHARLKNWTLGSFDVNFIEERIKIAVEKGKETGLPIYCGEFGCIVNDVPAEVRQNWFRDMIAVFDKYDIPYTVWDYKGGFRVFNRDNTPFDETILKILTGKYLQD